MLDEVKDDRSDCAPLQEDRWAEGYCALPIRPRGQYQKHE